MGDQRFRLLTRSDFDGLVCAALFRELDMVDEVGFVHPQDMQDGKIPVTDHDISANLPYVAGIHLCFDHHLSEVTRVPAADNYFNRPQAPSAARVVYDHFGGRAAFPGVSEELMAAVDMADSAKFTVNDILQPEGWVLLSFIVDPHTGLGRYRDFRISNVQLMRNMVEHLRTGSIDEILLLPDMRERVNLYFEHESRFKDQVSHAAKSHGGVYVVDMREEDPIYVGNRFMVYAMYPECSVSIHVLKGQNGSKVTLATGKSIVNRTSPSNIGALMLELGGGGHTAAGECQVDCDRADDILARLTDRLNADC